MIILVLVVSSDALADSITCGQQIIEDDQLQGMTTMQVEEKCGKPAEMRDNVWVYQRPGQFTKILNFNDNGELQSITTESQ